MYLDYDPCEWDPVHNRFSRREYYGEGVYSNDSGCLHPVSILVGAARYRLCAQCAELPEFRNIKVRFDPNNNNDKLTITHAWLAVPSTTCWSMGLQLSSLNMTCRRSRPGAKNKHVVKV